MRFKILQLLKEKTPRHISGEEMAQLFHVSRTTIWKNINTLQTEGYQIEGSTRRGYRLLGIPDLLYPVEITSGLESKIIAASPALVHYYRQVDSTNDILKKMAEEGAAEGTVTVTEKQTRGKGRLGRSWSAPFGKCILLSILLRPRITPREAPLLTLLAAAAIVKALENILPGMDIGIKWPNDLLLKGRKVCGILTELKAEADLLHYLVLGIGLNVNVTAQDFPPELDGVATSLYLENNFTAISRRQLACQILQEMDNFYEEYRAGGPQVILSQWKKHNLTLGRNITIKTVSGSFFGRATDLAPDGALIVEDGNKQKKHFHAGEVTLK